MAADSGIQRDGRTTCEDEATSLAGFAESTANAPPGSESEASSSGGPESLLNSGEKRGGERDGC